MQVCGVRALSEVLVSIDQETIPTKSTAKKYLLKVSELKVSFKRLNTASKCSLESVYSYAYIEDHVHCVDIDLSCHECMNYNRFSSKNKENIFSGFIY